MVATSLALLVWRELAVAEPFLDIRGLARNPALTAVLVQQGGVNLVFYCVFFGLPLWLEHVRGFTPDAIGLLLLPVTVLSVLIVPVTARGIRRHGSVPMLIVGFGLMLLATSAIQLLDDAAPVALLVGIAILLGIPNGMNHFALQTRLYEVVQPERAGALAGLFQTFRYLGAISATSVLGVILERDLSTNGMHHVGWVMTGGAAVLLALTIAAARRHR